jgi:hypothetical protein
LTSFFWRAANCLEEAQGVRPETSASAGAAAPKTRAADSTVAAATDARPFFLAGAATAGRTDAALVVVTGALAWGRGGEGWGEAEKGVRRFAIRPPKEAL